MERSDKEAFVTEMQGALEGAAGTVFVDYTGLTVNQVNAVRARFREAGIGYRVVKNTLMTRVLAGAAYEDAIKCLKGSPTGVVIGYEDPVAAAKLTFDLAKEFKSLKVKGGILDNQALDSAGTEALSKMPSQRELQAAVVSLALSPGSNLIGQIKSPAGRIVGAIEKLIETKEAS